MIKLPFPPSTNNLTSVTRVWSKKQRKWIYQKIKTAAYRAWEKEAGWSITSGCRIRNWPARPAYHLEITLVRPDKRGRDVNNYDKSISDLLKAHGVTPDDKHMQSLTVRWADAQDGPTVKVQAGG